MWPFRKTITPTVTNEAYSRWLRAWQPPWVWFLCRSEIEQEALALLGDERSNDLVLAIGYAVRDPEAAEAGKDAAAGSAAGEEVLALRIAGDLIKKLSRGQQAQQPARQVPAPATIITPPESMAGLADRQAAADVAARKPDLRTLFGRPADSTVEPEVIAP